ncbi:Uncharacterized protein family (UPF0172) [Popillia japonica]|uniref:Uncharacterized protein family (UPF0172) n=1 Tax=Popillia japonica TaxID=7064 RepID=A0AAW1LI46_POPJA
MGDITFNAQAYCKIILHSVKYAHCSVNGVLLAKPVSKSKDIEFVDAIPLFHMSLNLTPMAEIALTEIDQYASQNGLIIAGYYMAHENFRECSFEKAYHRISEKIADNFGSACLVVVDNRRLSLTIDNIALRVAQFSDGKYKTVDTSKVSLYPTHTLEICSSLISSRSYVDLVDFDNHLDDIVLDWKNELVNKEIEKYCTDD